MNLLSIGAAYGVIVTSCSSEGWRRASIGLDGAVPIVSFVPLMMFAILFGLSMDYEVFLMSHIQEHYAQTRDNREAVVDGLAATARVITSAALIMVCVFGALRPQRRPDGQAVRRRHWRSAIVVDATVVRCLLVPAVMTMMGDANWWMPRWLDRALPHISIEGDEYFAQKDRELERVG